MAAAAARRAAPPLALLCEDVVRVVLWFACDRADASFAAYHAVHPVWCDVLRGFHLLHCRLAYTAVPRRIRTACGDPHRLLAELAHTHASSVFRGFGAGHAYTASPDARLRRAAIQALWTLHNAVETRLHAHLGLAPPPAAVLDGGGDGLAPCFDTTDRLHIASDAGAVADLESDCQLAEVVRAALRGYEEGPLCAAFGAQGGRSTREGGVVQRINMAYEDAKAYAVERGQLARGPGYAEPADDVTRAILESVEATDAAVQDVQVRPAAGSRTDPGGCASASTAAARARTWYEYILRLLNADDTLCLQCNKTFRLAESRWPAEVVALFNTPEYINAKGRDGQRHLERGALIAAGVYDPARNACAPGICVYHTRGAGTSFDYDEYDFIGVNHTCCGSDDAAAGCHVGLHSAEEGLYAVENAKRDWSTACM